MADPFTMAAIGIGASVGGTIFNTIGGWMGNQAQAQQAAYQSAIATANAKIAQQNADYALQSGEKQAQIYGMKAGQQAAAIRVRQGSSGIDVGSGSAVDVQKSQELVKDIDLNQIRTNAARVAYGYQTEGATATAQAQMYKSASENISAAGPFQAAGSILSGVGSVSSKWIQASQSGAFSGSGLGGSGDLNLGNPGGTGGSFGGLY